MTKWTDASEASEVVGNTRAGYLIKGLNFEAKDFVETGKLVAEFQKGMDEGGVKWMAQPRAQQILTAIGEGVPFSQQKLLEKGIGDGWIMIETHLVACLVDAMARNSDAEGEIWGLLPPDVRRRFLRMLGVQYFRVSDEVLARIAPEVGAEMGLMEDYLNDRSDSYLRSAFHGLLSVAKTSPTLAEKVVKQGLQATKVDRENSANAYFLVALYRELPSQRRILFEEVQYKMDELKTIVEGIAEEESLPMAKDEKFRSVANEFTSGVRKRLQDREMESKSKQEPEDVK